MTWVSPKGERREGKVALDPEGWNQLQIEAKVKDNSLTVTVNQKEILSISGAELPPRRLLVLQTPSPALRLRNLDLSLFRAGAEK